jgi:uncharacterized protein (TIGR02145 family)
MKSTLLSIRIILALCLLNLFLPLNSTAQVPQGIPYQAVARNGQGQPLANANVKVRFSILDSTATGTAVYVESHTTTTSALGLFTANVGMGTPSTGTFNSINWGQNFKFLKVELDTTATGNNYIDIGTQQMMSVPYALYAANANFSLNGASIGKHGETCLSCWGKAVWSSNGRCPQRSSINGTPDLLSPNLNYGLLTDNEGNKYETIKIGNQTWMAENLRTTHFNNGDPIAYWDPFLNASVLSDSLFSIYGYNNIGPRPGSGADSNQNNLLGTTPYYSTIVGINQGDSNFLSYGNLYDWFCVIDSRKICPLNWHVSTKADWDTLLNFILPNSATNLRPIGYSHWVDLQSYYPPIISNNIVGFGALPSGCQNTLPGGYNFRDSATWWTSNLSEGFPISNVLFGPNIYNSFEKEFKYAHQSVRCVKD